MVKQTRLIFDLSDVAQVVLRCKVKNCTGEVANSLVLSARRSGRHLKALLGLCFAR